MWSGICVHVEVRGQRLTVLTLLPCLRVPSSWLAHRLPESLLFLLSIFDSGVLGLQMLTLPSPAFVWILGVRIQVHGLGWQALS